MDAQGNTKEGCNDGETPEKKDPESEVVDVIEPDQTVNQNTGTNVDVDEDKKPDDDIADKKFQIKSQQEKEETQKIEVNENTFEQDVIFGNRNTINNNYSINERNGMPTQLELLDTKEIKFDVQSSSNKAIEFITKENFIIVNCAHYGISNSLIQTIAHNEIYKNHQKQEVSFDTYESSDIVHLIEDCKRQTLTKDSNKLLLFIKDSKNKKTPALLNSLRKKSYHGKLDVQKRLSSDFHIIYVTYHEDLNYLKESPFDFHIINTFKIYTKKYGISQDQIRIIRDDQKENHWNPDERNLLRDLDKIIDDPNFDAIIRNKREESKTSFKEIFKNKQEPVGKYVLFVATIFPELPPDLFNRYVRVLIEDKKKVYIKDKKVSLLSIWQEDTDSILDDCGLETFYVNNQSFVDFKNSNEEAKCRNILFRKFTLFADQQARIFIEKQALFTTKVSRPLHNRIHPVIAKLNTYFKNYYGNEILVSWLKSLEKQRETIVGYINKVQTLESHIESLNKKNDILKQNKNIENEEDFLKKLKELYPINFSQEYESQLKKLQYVKFLFYKEEGIPNNVSIQTTLKQLNELKNSLEQELQEIRLKLYRNIDILDENIYLYVDLLTMILENDESKELIPQFFSNRFSEVSKYRVILDILTKFQIKNDFYNSLEFYKLSLEHKSDTINDYAIHQFVTLLLKDPLNFYKYIKEIQNWFPDVSSSLKEYTKLERNILKVYLFTITDQKKKDKYHKQNSKLIKSDVYKALFDNFESLKESLEFITKMLFNTYVFFKNEDDKKDDFRSRLIQHQLASIVSYWYSLLCRIGESEIAETQIAEKKKLLTETIRNILPKDQSKKLLLNLKQNRRNLNINASKIKDINEKKKLKVKRGYLIEFINQLKK